MPVRKVYVPWMSLGYYIFVVSLYRENVRAVGFYGITTISFNLASYFNYSRSQILGSTFPVTATGCWGFCDSGRAWVNGR